MSVGSKRPKGIKRCDSSLQMPAPGENHECPSRARGWGVLTFVLIGALILREQVEFRVLEQIVTILLT
jgi:hypothetical protein